MGLPGEPVALEAAGGSGASELTAQPLMVRTRRAPVIVIREDDAPLRGACPCLPGSVRGVTHTDYVPNAPLPVRRAPPSAGVSPHPCETASVGGRRRGGGGSSGAIEQIRPIRWWTVEESGVQWCLRE